MDDRVTDLNDRYAAGRISCRQWSAALKALRSTTPRPAQLRTDTRPDRQTRAALGRVFDTWTTRRRREARGSLVAALAAGRVQEVRRQGAADVALLARLDQHLAHVRDRRRRPWWK